MTAQEQLSQRVAALEAVAVDRDRLAGFGRLYAGFVPAMVALTFVPYYESEPGGVEYLTLWEMTRNELGVFGLLLVTTLSAFLVIGVFRPRLRRAPIGVAVIAAVLVLMLVSGLGTGSQDPDHSAGGLIAIGLGTSLLVITAVHLRVLRGHRAAAPRRRLGGAPR